MIDTDYRAEALEYLLNKDCLSERYYPLVPLKNTLIRQAGMLGCKTKEDMARLSDTELEKLAGLGAGDADTVRLLRRFLNLYDPNPQKFREIEKLDASPEEKLAFKELYCLPGVKQTRASLYFLSGYKTLKAVADATPEEILAGTAAAICANCLVCTVPLPKEVRTHIAVARAFTLGKE